MGLLEWFWGGSDSRASRSASAMTAALGEIDGIFRPARKEQLALIEEQKRRRIDDDSADDHGIDVDLDHGVAVVRIEKSIAE